MAARKRSAGSTPRIVLRDFTEVASRRLDLAKRVVVVGRMRSGKTRLLKYMLQLAQRHDLTHQRSQGVPSPKGIDLVLGLDVVDDFRGQSDDHQVQEWTSRLSECKVEEGDGDPQRQFSAIHANKSSFAEDIRFLLEHHAVPWLASRRTMVVIDGDDADMVGSRPTALLPIVRSHIASVFATSRTLPASAMLREIDLVVLLPPFNYTEIRRLHKAFFADTGVSPAMLWRCLNSVVVPHFSAIVCDPQGETALDRLFLVRASEPLYDSTVSEEIGLRHVLRLSRHCFHQKYFDWDKFVHTTEAALLRGTNLSTCPDEEIERCSYSAEQHQHGE